VRRNIKNVEHKIPNGVDRNERSSLPPFHPA